MKLPSTPQHSEAPRSSSRKEREQLVARLQLAAREGDGVLTPNLIAALNAAAAALHDAVSERGMLVGWIQEIHEGRPVFYAGDMDPRAVHDNGKSCYPVYRHQSSERKD